MGEFGQTHVQLRTRQVPRSHSEPIATVVFAALREPYAPFGIATATNSRQLVGVWRPPNFFSKQCVSRKTSGRNLLQDSSTVLSRRQEYPTTRMRSRSALRKREAARPVSRGMRSRC